jgi:hypothetical protein
MHQATRLEDGAAEAWRNELLPVQLTRSGSASLSGENAARLKDFVRFFQGEVNQTVATSRGHLTDVLHGPLVVRGANISLYQLREASQGEDIYLDVEAFLAGKGAETKAFHHRYERVGLQETSPQNNFRRIISCRIPIGQFCNHKINYTTARHSRIPLELALFVLNSAFADWYFRLGSTNAAVSHYQLANIPCPRFGRAQSQVDSMFCQKVGRFLERRDFDYIEEACMGLAEAEGTSPTMERVVVSLVRFIEAEEERRGDIARSARSTLAADSQACQLVLDKILLTLLGLGAARYDYLAARLSEML